MAKPASHDLLRMISLRGPKTGLAVDLAPRVRESVALPLMDSNLSLLGEPELLTRVFRTVDRLDQGARAATSLAELRGGLVGAAGLSGLKLTFGGVPGVPLEGVAQSDLFRKDLRAVYDSWLAQKLTAAESADIEGHADLLRAAALVLEWSERPVATADSSLEIWLHSTILLTPRAWTSLDQASKETAARRDLKPNAPKKSRNLTASELRSKIVEVARGHSALRHVGNAIVEAQAQWMRAQAIFVDEIAEHTGRERIVAASTAAAAAVRTTNPSAHSPDSATKNNEAIIKSLALKIDAINGIPPTTKQSIASRLGDRFQLSQEAFDGLNVMANPEASHFCDEIQAIETAILQDLPPAPSGTQPVRPPLISTLGLGNLVVARSRLVGYEANEIAHIENVLPGEKKKNEIEKTTRMEIAQEDEITTENETQTDTNTTDSDSMESTTESNMEKSLSVDAGVNLSSKYGATKVDSSLDVAFQKSNTEAASETVEEVREIITRNVERTRELVRNLRRVTTVDETRTLTNHDIDNTTLGVGGAPVAISAAYRWVEKVEEIELRQYGTRLMVEFHIPEPAVSILETKKTNQEMASYSLPPFDVKPSDINRESYMCLAQRYGTEIEPPPSEWVEVPYYHSSQVTETANTSSEHVATGLIMVPAEYRPTFVHVTVSTPPKASREEWKTPYITVAVGTTGRIYTYQYTNGTTKSVWGPVLMCEWPDISLVGSITRTASFDPSLAIAQGVPISVSATQVYDNAFTVIAVIKAKLTDEAWAAWQLDVWGRLRQAYRNKKEELERDMRTLQLDATFGQEAITERPSAINRRTERTELQKWAIKAMRYETFDFHPMVTEDGLQEIDAADAHAQAPIVGFFEQAFEWRQMSYFFYPYYWARRDTWQMRQQQRSVDNVYEAFLKAGAARVIVPVTPGYERRLLCYLNFGETGLATLIPGVDVECPDDPLGGTDDVAVANFHDVGIDILTARHGDLVRGTGTLAIARDSAQVTINADSLWAASPEDIGRELQISGRDYAIVAVPSATELVLDRPIETDSDNTAAYVAGSMPYGTPWQIRVPTNLLVLDKGALE